jgi:hypothetical protein
LDWLKVALSAYLVFQVIGLAGYIARVGKPREPVTANEAAITMLIQLFFFVMFLVIWTRL